jgi:hypothetical protein
MDSPSPIELQIMRSIITQNLGTNSPVLRQLPMLRFDHRNMTGTGYFMQFAPLPEALRVEQVNTAISTDLPTHLPAPRDVAAFTMFVDDGLISSFEGYMFGDVKWPDQLLEKWLLVDSIWKTAGHNRG